MKTHVNLRSVKRGIVRTLFLTLLFATAATRLPAQAPPNPVPPPENIPSGALVIPMDNVNQGNAAGTTFNLRAYGLANLLLQNDVSVKWVIKPGKSKDAVDFTASVDRIAGTAGTASGTVNFSGGPFVIPAEFDNPAVRNLISTFNTGQTPVTVYKTNAATTADVRYTLTHKPRIAVGPDTGNFGAAVYESLFNRAGIPNFTVGVADINQPGACYTLATQGHQTNPAFVNTFKQFVQGGGNLILQCASVGTFENNPNGLFQTTAGYSLFTSNPPSPNEINNNSFSYPEGSMPFNQFIGILADQDGAVTEYAYAPGSVAAHGNRVAVVNTGANSDKFVATVSQYNGTSAVGGVVFEFGGHDYARPDDAGETDSELAMLNGQRMQLNSVFVPAGTVCTQPQDVVGYKSVRRVNVRQGGPPIAPGDTLEWTIDYVNVPQNQTNHFDFQIRDIIGEFAGFQTFAGTPVVVNAFNGAIAAPNLAFDGVGNDASADLLAPGAFLPIGGRIQVKVRTIVAANVLILNPSGYTLFNQTTARSLTLTAAPTTKSDAIDTTNTNIFGVDTPPAGSVNQPQNGSIINPTQVPLGPTAANASIQGRVSTAGGVGIGNAIVSVVNAATGEVVSARTNHLGLFTIGDLEVNEIYLITVNHKVYRFPTEPMVLNLDDNVTGLTFTGRLP